jgi:hypothetical protein
MVNNSEILRILREATLSEAKPIGLVQTDKIIGQSKGENDAYYKDVKKKMSDYEKASTSSMEGAIEEPKFNYENNDEVEYHEDMEIRNGMEMLNYDRKPSEKFSQRAKEAIEGSSNMGNNPEWANVYPEQKGFTGPDFGKKLVDRIERSKKKRDAATPTFDQFGDDIEEKNVGVNKSKSAYKPAVSKKPVAIGESVIMENEEKTFKIEFWVQNNDDYEDKSMNVKAKSKEEALQIFKKEHGHIAKNVKVVENAPPKPKVRQQDNKPLDVPVSPAERKTAPPKVRQQDNPVNKADSDLTENRRNIKTVKITVPNEQILKRLNSTPALNWLSRLKLQVGENIENVNHVQFSHMERSYPLIGVTVEDITTKNNKTTNESKMKRLKFKKPFNGVETALKVIPETYKVNNKVFEMTDGNEHYRVRWEGSLNEGKAVVLSSFHQEALNEDVAKIKHLMGFKSQDTLGNLKGGQRLTEDKTFFEMLKKSQALNEAEAKPDFLDLDGDGDKKEPMKQAAKGVKSTKKQGIQEYAPDYDDPYDDHSPLPEEWEFILYNGKEIDTNDKYLLDTILDTIGLTFYDSNGLYEPLTTSLGETISVDDTHPEIQKLQPRLLAIANKLNTGVAPDEKDTKLVDTILDKYYKYVDKWEPIDHTMDEAEAKPDFLDLDKDGDKKEPMKQAAKGVKSTKKQGIQEYDEYEGETPDYTTDKHNILVRHPEDDYAHPDPDDDDDITEYDQLALKDDITIVSKDAKLIIYKSEFDSPDTQRIIPIGRLVIPKNKTHDIEIYEDGSAEIVLHPQTVYGTSDYIKLLDKLKVGRSENVYITAPIDSKEVNKILTAKKSFAYYDTSEPPSDDYSRE